MAASNRSFAPDTLISRYVPHFTTQKELIPEHYLLIEILRRTVVDLTELADSTPRMFRDSVNFLQDWSEEPFSFNWICLHLGLDANQIRLKIARSLDMPDSFLGYCEGL